MSSSYIPPDLPPHCKPDTPLLVLLSQTLGTCVPSYLALFSTTAGLLSIVSWLFAQMPQIWKNYMRGSVDGLSLGFLTIWLAGDVCNFLGAMWTHQMWFQRVVGGYYVFVDVILVSQYFYFSAINPPSVLLGRHMHYDDSIDDDDDSFNDSYLVDTDTESDRKKRKQRATSTPRARSRSLASTLIITLAVLLHLVGATPIGMTADPAPSKGGLTLESIGGVLSWFSTLLYLTSRLPQLLLNLRRRSTSGLAISLFVAAFFGNFFYSLSLLLNPLGHCDFPPYGGGGLVGEGGSRRAEWWGRTLPFFLGASGVLGLDAAVGWQWVLWGESEEFEGCNDVGDGEGWWPWNGWFRDERGEEEAKPLVSEASVQYGATMVE